MKSIVLLLGALCACVGASARPLVLESRSVLPAYADEFAFAGSEVISTKWESLGGEWPNEQFRTSASLYQRGTNGKWTLVRELASEQGTDDYGAGVGMTGNVAALAMPSGLQVWERSASGWTQATVNPASRIRGSRVDVAGNTVLVSVVVNGSVCSQQAAVLSRGANGTWAISARLAAPAGTCIDDFDLDAGRALVHVSDTDTEDTQVLVFEQSGSSWTLAATLTSPDANVHLASAVALRGDLAIVSASIRGAHVFRRSSAGWQFAGYLVNPDSYDEGQSDGDIGISDQYVVKTSWNINRRTEVVYVYRRLADQGFEHVANLATPAPNGFGNVRIDNGRVVAAYGPELYAFDLPASFDVPEVVQDDFETGMAAQWTPMPGSQLAVVSNGQTRVYRQSSLAGDAGAIHAADFTNQHVSADIRPTAFQGGTDQWVGLITRYTDANNYYYLTLRHSGQLTLKRMLNGAITELASYPMQASLTWHRLGLESSGTMHMVYVDGDLVTYAFDASHTHGHAGIRTYRASADFDNVVISPGPLASLAYTDRVATGGNWDGDWVRGGSTFIQTSPDSGDARVVSGLPSEDAAVQATVTFGTGTGTPWAGLIVRYVDARNYYYVTMRANELSLRKLTNGAISVLDSAPFTRQPGVAVPMRLEAVGDRLRVYVNDELRLESSGAEVAAGKVGVMTYRAAARFENYWAYEP